MTRSPVIRPPRNGVVYTNNSAGRLHLSTGEFFSDGSCWSARCAIELSNGRFAAEASRRSASEKNLTLDDAVRYVATGELP